MSARVGLLGPNIDRFVLLREVWSKEAKIGLADTFYDAEQKLQDGVRSGKMELYRVYENQVGPLHACGWLILERMGGMLFIWCYQGRGLVCLIHQFREFARVNGFQQLSFFTRHAAAIRALRRFKPRVYKKYSPDEVQYVIDVRRAA